MEESALKGGQCALELTSFLGGGGGEESEKGRRDVKSKGPADCKSGKSRGLLFSSRKGDGGYAWTWRQVENFPRWVKVSC